MSLCRTEALTLRTFDFGDTSQIVHLFTREYGKVHVLAKGAKREKGPFAGPIDSAIRAEIIFYDRKTSGLHLLKAFHALDAFPNLRRGLRRFYAAFAVLEILVEGTREESVSAELFDLGVAALSALDADDPPDLGALLLHFDARALHLLGFLPRFTACVGCGGPIEEDGPAFFSPLRGGALCARCPTRDPNRMPATVGALKVLERLGERATTSPGRASLPGPLFAEMRSILDRYLPFVFEKELKARRFTAVR